MKHCIKILSLSFIFLFIFSCSNKTKIAGRYEGVLNTTQNTKQLITNKCIVIVNDDNSMSIDIQGENIYKDNISISKEELIKIDDYSYVASKNSKNYTFVFHSGYMVLTIENTDNTTTKGELSKIS
ncbi:hypothetical protein Bint_2846 [Brachyspira intermedia PWS/A]|uniref:Lipoprotein n=1 Tax=Brachyspira intermedia (strain ATCC 51140 / PWS/A) TaxID=1045858 RepID=G0EI85_BRAIP|nr:hypothetical protein [Brachyspira intermedia]AEM23440.1 hypothetical protein Bint_2846 [Brachyspira intermedia PWS/A]